MMFKRDPSRLILILTVIVWAIVCFCVLRIDAKAETPPDDGRLPGDDVPATEPCYIDHKDFENAKIEEALLLAAHKIENVTVSHYDCCVKCCGKTDGITASGDKAIPGVTVAVDPDTIPIGADVLVDYGDGEIHYYKASDTGNGVKGNHIDLCVSSHEEAIQLGIRKATVFWVEN